MEPKLQYLTSLFSLGGKAACAFVVQYYLVNTLSAPDFALWATVLSLCVLVSIFDLGIGQYIMTGLISRDNDREHTAVLLSNGLLLSSFLGVLAGATMFMLLGQFDWKASALISGIIAIRVVLIPFSAHLFALGRYHERKLIEFLSYALSLVAVVLLGDPERIVGVLVLFNVSLTMGSVLIALRSTSLRPVRLEGARITRPVLRDMLRGAMPYFIHNAAGLLFYGGFIWLMSFSLDSLDLARLAVLHTLVFSNSLQVAEVAFKTRQVRLTDLSYFRRIEGAVAVGSAVMIVVMAAGGVTMIGWYAAKYQFTTAELVVYSIFVGSELYWLLVHSRMQILTGCEWRLVMSAVSRILAFVGILALVRLTDANLMGLLLGLAAASACLLACFRLGWRDPSVSPNISPALNH